MTIIQFQRCRLEIDHAAQFMQTIFEDGTSAPATPNYRESDIARAHERTSSAIAAIRGR